MNEPRVYTSADFDTVEETNLSNNPSFMDVLDARLSRRKVVVGGMTAATSLIFAGGLAGCDDSADLPPPAPPPPAAPTTLGFTAVQKNLLDTVTVPTGYTATPIYKLGTPIAAGTAAYVGDGSETGDSYASRAGDHHDGMYFFGLNAAGAPDRTASARGILCINHENITQIFLHPTGPTVDAVSGARTVADEVLKEMNVHGVSVIEVARPAGSLAHALVPDSTFNRRITSLTPMQINGPARGSRFMVSAYSTNGQMTRGTINNCANGFTPWGTYLTCEENWAFYFRRDTGDNTNRTTADVTALNRVGITQGAVGNYGWTTVVPTDPADTTYARWNATANTATATTGAGDFRNAPNTFGWIVEIDPFTATSVPRKRTALGRFNHEGCWPAKVTSGKPVVFYMGDDSRGEYIYKFVSRQNFDPALTGLAAGDRYMDDGTLYVARFAADGTGSWRALVFGSNGLTEDSAVFPFTSQAAVLVNARLAADVAGATRMDRPEWGAVNPVNGEVYFTLTNNSGRGVASGPAPDAPNPRSYTDVKGAATQRGNVNGHIIRFREAGNDPTATTFNWDIYAFGAQANAPTADNISGLTDDNDFSSPDGLWFAREGLAATNGLLWIQTDDGAYTDVTNCMLLAAVPGQVGDGGTALVTAVSGAATVTNTTYVGRAQTASNLRRFLVGPLGCELTGLDSTPDGLTLFANIQHPGENTPLSALGTPASFESHYPDGGTARPRSTTLAITRDNGGIVGVA